MFVKKKISSQTFLHVLGKYFVHNGMINMNGFTLLQIYNFKLSPFATKISAFPFLSFAEIGRISSIIKNTLRKSS